MKKVFVLIVALLPLFAITANAQNKKPSKEAITTALVDSQQYIFVAQTAIPMSGRTVQLNSTDYDLTISKDTIIAYLPYYGRAYTAPLDPTETGIKFTSTSFEYKKEAKKKGGWIISITPKDASGVQQLTISISSTGYSTLQITNTTRQPITYYGYLKSGKKK